MPHLSKTLYLIFLMIGFALPPIDSYADECRSDDADRLEFRLTADGFPRQAEFVVYLPPCYDSNREEPYPLLLLLHGHNMDLTTWDELGIRNAYEHYANFEDSAPFLIATVRETDNLIDIFASDFDRLLLDHILPAIERNFNSGGDRSRRAIGGISRGALWAADIAFRNPGLFRQIGLHSMPGSPFYEAEFHRLITAANEAGETFNVLLDIGDKDPFLPRGRNMIEMLTQEKIPLDLRIQAGDHSTDYWKANLADYLSWYGRSFISDKSIGAGSSPK